MSTLGILLMVVGAALLVAETHLPSHGALGAGATGALTAGVALALSGSGASAGAVAGAAAAAGAAALALTVLVVLKSLAVRRLTVRSGPQALLGQVGTVRHVPAPLGQVHVDGALWRARVWELEGEGALAEGSPIVVERVDGLTLTVRAAEEWEVSP
jgi:membrane-bound serine protease (ClpP class)